MQSTRLLSRLLLGFAALVILLATLPALRAQTAAPTPASPAPIAQATVSNAPTPALALFVGEKDAGLLTIVDPDALKVIAKIPVGNQPHEVAALGSLVFVSNSGASAITVVDAVRQARLPSIDTGLFGGFHGFAVAGGKLYIAHEQTRLLTRYNPATQNFDWVFGTGLGSHLILVTPDERSIYLASSPTASMVIMESGGGARGGGGARRGGGGNRGWSFASFPAGTRMEGLDVSPDGKEFWGVSINDKKIIIVNIAEKKIVHVIDLPTQFTNRAKFTVDGKYVFINELQGNQLFVYDPATRQEVKRIEIGAGGEGIFIDPRGKRAYYAVSRGGKLAAIDTETLTVIGEVTGLRNPDGMSWYDASK